jgi:hypothetical protein
MSIRDYYARRDCEPTKEGYFATKSDAAGWAHRNSDGAQVDIFRRTKTKGWVWVSSTLTTVCRPLVEAA